MDGVTVSGGKQTVAVLGLVVLVVLAGCSALDAHHTDTTVDGSGTPETAEETTLSADESTPSAAETSGYPDVFENVTASVDDASADKFEALVTDESGELTADGERLLDRLEVVEALGTVQRDAVVESVVASGTLDGEGIETLDAILASPEQFAAEVLRSGLEDTTGDGLTDGETDALGLDPSDLDDQVVDIALAVRDGGYDETAIRYVERLDELSTHQDNEYELWAQAEQLGLLDEAVANGTVTERQLWKLENNASNRLLNGMELEFGTDPEQADTSGDGYEDHLLWGPMQDLGLDVSPDTPNVFVEIDTAEGVSPPSDAQLVAIQETLAGEPPDDIGPIAVDFFVCTADVDDIDTVDEMDDVAAEHRNITGLGFHYLFVSDGLEPETVHGAAYTSRHDPSWMVVDGTLEESFGEMYEASLIAHELGHSLGIDKDAYEGIDSFDVSIDEYNSVMNYNHDGENVTFSTGDPFDDYERMAESEFGSQYQEHDALEEMWYDGSVDEDALC